MEEQGAQVPERWKARIPSRALGWGACIVGVFLVAFGGAGWFVPEDMVSEIGFWVTRVGGAFVVMIGGFWVGLGRMQFRLLDQLRTHGRDSTAQVLEQNPQHHRTLVELTTRKGPLLLYISTQRHKDWRTFALHTQVSIRYLPRDPRVLLVGRPQTRR